MNQSTHEYLCLPDLRTRKRFDSCWIDPTQVSDNYLWVFEADGRVRSGCLNMERSYLTRGNSHRAYVELREAAARTDKARFSAQRWLTLNEEWDHE